MVKVNRKLDFSSFNAKEKTKKSFKTRNVDKKLNLLSFTKEAKTIDDLEVKTPSGGKTTKVDETNDDFPELLEVLSLNQKNLKRKRTYTCMVKKCDRKLNNLTSLKAHVRAKHINMKGYICAFTECPRKSARNQYKCHQGKEIWNKEDIEAHEKLQSRGKKIPKVDPKKKTFRCSLCPKRKYSSKTATQLHIRLKHKGHGKISMFEMSEFQESVTEIHHPELVEVLPLNQKNLKFVIVEYLCPLGYDKWCNSSNKKFKNAECVKKHLLNFHKIPRKLQKPRFAPIRRITYKS